MTARELVDKILEECWRKKPLGERFDVERAVAIVDLERASDVEAFDREYLCDPPWHARVFQGGEVDWLVEHEYVDELFAKDYESLAWKDEDEEVILVPKGSKFEPSLEHVRYLKRESRRAPEMTEMEAVLVELKEISEKSFMHHDKGYRIWASDWIMEALFVSGQLCCCKDFSANPTYSDALVSFTCAEHGQVTIDRREIPEANATYPYPPYPRPREGPPPRRGLIPRAR